MYPDNRLQLTWSFLATDSIIYLTDRSRKNDMLGAIMLSFPGQNPTASYLPRGRHGPFNMSVFYHVPGFVHNTFEQDRDKEWDRIVYTDGTIRICFQAFWSWFSKPRRFIRYAELHFDAGVGRGYDYMGRQEWVFNGGGGGFLTNAIWDSNPNANLRQPAPV